MARWWWPCRILCRGNRRFEKAPDLPLLIALGSTRHVAKLLNTDAMLFQEFCDRFSKYGDRTLTLFADGRPGEVPV
jgi:hypothetical protein